MEDVVNLKLSGPYKLFGKHTQLFFDADVSQKNGIYLWTIKYGNGYLIDYIGETGKTFSKRIKEHLIEMLGGNYLICDSDMLLQGKERIVWNGLWRKGTIDNIGEFIRDYENYAPIIKRYIEIHDIFLAPLTVDRRKRQLIEGNVTKIIKEQNPPVSNLLPSDIRYVYNRKENEEEFNVNIESNENVFGLPKTFKI
ncbi:MAG: hypothetical protein U9P81_07700 [Euryarchaeota archaeon]|nr:hypothetical protein [Euryarchaeota archaeon]